MERDRARAADNEENGRLFRRRTMPQAQFARIAEPIDAEGIDTPVELPDNPGFPRAQAWGKQHPGWMRCTRLRPTAASCHVRVGPRQPCRAVLLCGSMSRNERIGSAAVSGGRGTGLYVLAIARVACTAVFGA